MSLTTRKNPSVKALQSYMAKAKKHDDAALLEWEMSCLQSGKRGHVYDQEELKDLYSRYDPDAPRGASKICHKYSHVKNERGERQEFGYIVVKRAHIHCWIDEHAYNPDSKQTGNQLIDEINCWNEFAERPEADLLCPILKYFTSKSDKVAPTSNTMLDNVIIISQKAVEVGPAAYVCKFAADLNQQYGLGGTRAIDRFNDMMAFSHRQGWRDAIKNPGNCGVIYDYHSNCYKAVFIDYAL